MQGYRGPLRLIVALVCLVLMATALAPSGEAQFTVTKGVAATSLSLTTDPANCAANTLAVGIDTTGAAECAATSITPQFARVGIGVAADATAEFRIRSTGADSHGLMWFDNSTAGKSLSILSGTDTLGDGVMAWGSDDTLRFGTVTTAPTTGFRATATFGSGEGGTAKALVVNNGTSTGNILELQDNGTPVVTVADGGAVSVTSTITSSASTNVGWAVVAGADTACNTTCTSACAFGWNLTAGNITGTLLACTDATADACLCIGSS